MKATTEHLEYLDALRASGVTNMFWAVPYIEAEFGVLHNDAVEILKQWMGGFTERVKRGEARL